MPSSLHPVKLVAAALNLLTKQQAWAAQRLAEHAGQTLRISLGKLNLTLTIESDGQLAQADSAIVPDVTLDLMLEKLSVSALVDRQSRPALAQWVHITGQASLAQTVSELARDLRPDPEDALAHWLGDLPARRLVNGAKGLVGAAHSFMRSLSENVAEYLSEESQMVTSTSALASFAQEREQTSLQISLLEQRQAALQVRLQRLRPHAGSPQ